MSKSSPREDQEYSAEQLGIEVSTQRLQAYSDGIFAIGSTILVLGLSIPIVPKEHASTELIPKLLEFWPGKIIAYALSFSVVTVYWIAHHAAFHHIRRSNRTLMALNALFLFWIVFIPFPTALAGRYFDQPISAFLYGATLLLAGLSLQLLWWYATHKHRLVDPRLDKNLIHAISRANLYAPLLCAFAMAMSFLSITLSFILLLTVPLILFFPARVKKRNTASSS